MIIGVGSIGKRHFQSLINLNGKANFYLVDPIFSKIKKSISNLNKFNPDIDNHENFDFIVIGSGPSGSITASELQKISDKILLIECPKFLFPFLRSIIASCTRDGGFPPLMITPIDFVNLYEKNKKN